MSAGALLDHGDVAAAGVQENVSAATGQSRFACMVVTWKSG